MSGRFKRKDEVDHRQPGAHEQSRASGLGKVANGDLGRLAPRIGDIARARVREGTQAPGLSAEKRAEIERMLEAPGGREPGS